MRLILNRLEYAMTGHSTRTSVAIAGTLALALTACGSDALTTSADAPPATGEQSDEPVGSEPTRGQMNETESTQSAALPTIVVTTNVLGDVVSEVVGAAAEVITVMPVDADPHDFQASAREIDEVMQADALIVNGGSYEEGLLDVIDGAVDDGVPTFEALDAVTTIEYEEPGHSDLGDDHDDEHGHDEHGHDEHDEHGHDEEKDEHDDEHDDEEHGDEEHGDEEHGDEEHDGHDHHHSGEDPHFFTDPTQMAAAVDGIVDFLQDTIEFADPTALEASADAYLARLSQLDSDVAEMMSALPEGDRVLVTNHQVFGYFADRYGFEVIGAVIPSGTTLDTTSGGELDELSELIEDEGVRAIFSDTSASDELIQTLADEVGGVAVVALFTESLGAPGGDGGTYLDMVRTNAERIVGALG